MSSRYDEVDESEPAAGGAVPARPPLEPPPVVSKRQVWTSVAAIVLAAAIGVGAAFGFDVCQAAKSVGVSLDACAAKPAPAPAPEPEPGKQ